MTFRPACTPHRKALPSMVPSMVLLFSNSRGHLHSDHQTLNSQDLPPSCPALHGPLRVLTVGGCEGEPGPETTLQNPKAGPSLAPARWQLTTFLN